jgi:hypothetical protein
MKVELAPLSLSGSRIFSTATLRLLPKIDKSIRGLKLLLRFLSCHDFVASFQHQRE